ncbi:MAG: hypothetical protein DRQ51_06020 [Gammaproteobacteria bacterium]|nr:MAG: hypothetical protein DRQ51_06020 [Gammaproteobacteria bacterium]
MLFIFSIIYGCIVAIIINLISFLLIKKSNLSIISLYFNGMVKLGLLIFLLSIGFYIFLLNILQIMLSYALFNFAIILNFKR